MKFNQVRGRVTLLPSPFFSHYTLLAGFHCIWFDSSSLSLLQDERDRLAVSCNYCCCTNIMVL